MPTTISQSFNPNAFSQWLESSQIKAIDSDFCAFLKSGNRELYEILCRYRLGMAWDDESDHSLFLIQIAQALEDYLIQLFALYTDVSHLKTTASAAQHQAIFRSVFVKPSRRLKIDPMLDFTAITRRLHTDDSFSYPLNETQWVAIGLRIYERHSSEDEPYQMMLQWCGLVIHNELKPYLDTWAVFTLPARVDLSQLIETQDSDAGFRQTLEAYWRVRQGFQLTDQGASDVAVADQLYYCLECHQKKTDYCRTGFFKKKSDQQAGFKSNQLDELLEGCPLDERISEMHWLKRRHWAIASLAMIMRDNPLCSLTGHRICNDCMKSCIYQKQEPVDIPEVESRVLKDVLAMQWGCEVYDLLVRWNPLRPEQYMPKPYQYKKVLVMGMGPAGLAMSHHLLMEGCAVVGMDGLKLEPSHQWLNPIASYSDLTQPLDRRPVSGFGGVAEYGITARWDKNLLSLAQMAVLRRSYFSVYGGVRFGGTVTLDQAWQLGFDHVVIAVGAGLPRELSIPGSLAIGMLQANDFLMNLHLSGAQRPDVLHAIQLQMPILVIGAGLTAVDTATESRAYYLAQVEQLLCRYEQLVEWKSTTAIFSEFSEPSLGILKQMLTHARQVRRSKSAALHELISSWGGVNIVYRQSMERSPAYRHNHQELEHALNEGIGFWEWLIPVEVKVDSHGYVKALVVNHHGGHRELPAKTILVATGSSNNIAYAYEHRDALKKQGHYYTGFSLEKGRLVEQPMPTTLKQADVPALTSYVNNNSLVSFIGDTHPVFHGSVVKAIASSMRLYPKIMAALSIKKPDYRMTYQAFRQSIDGLFSVTLISTVRLSADWVEMRVHAPIHAKRYCLGNFYRLQTLEATAKKLAGVLMHSEPVALYPISVDPVGGNLTFWLRTQGSSCRLLSQANVGRSLALMGPTGMNYKPTDVSSRMLIFAESYWVMLALTIVESCLSRGQAVTLLIHPGQYPVDALESRLSQMGSLLEWSYGDTLSFDWHGWMTDQPVELLLLLQSHHHCRIKQQIHHMVSQYNHVSVHAAVDVSMQCMLKGICAQCLVYQVDEVTQTRTKAVYACSWQIQPYQWVDWDSAKDRVKQNVMHEQVAKLYLNYLESHHG